MITFKQYLIEARQAPLYHGTNVADLKSILRQDKLNTGFYDSDAHWITPEGSIVSLTRDFKFAYKWKDYYQTDRAAVIQLDQQKLIQRYKVKPFNFFSTWEPAKARYMGRDAKRQAQYSFGVDPNQFEEAVTKPITNLHKYVTAIWVDQFHVSKIQKKFPQYADRIKSFGERKR